MMRTSFNMISRSAAETDALGGRLAAILRAGDVVALTGELGSGKTVLAQGVCAGLDVHDPVTSPTFILVQEYQGRLPVFHFDFYRLDSIREIEALDLDEYFDAGGVCLIEWAERGEPLLPRDRFSIVLEHLEEDGHLTETGRQIQISALSDRNLRGLAL